MAICAHELALLQLCKDDCAPTAAHELADASDRVISGQMVPMHHPRGKHVMTVGASYAVFQRCHPCSRRHHSSALSLKTWCSTAVSMLIAVVGAATRSAV